MTLPDPAKPVIVAERLELWVPAAGDLLPMADIVMNDETARYLGPPGSRADNYLRVQSKAGSWLLHGYGTFAVRLRGEAAIIGNCGIFHSYREMGEDFDDMPEAGWIISSGHVGKGYASEAMEAALGWFDASHGKRRIVCMIEEGNAPSFALAARLGFTQLRRVAMPERADIVLLERAT